MVIPALAGGSLIFLAIIVVLVIVVAFSYFTYRGSGINAHPHSGHDDDGPGDTGQAPGADGPSRPGGHGRVPEDPSRLGGEGSIPTHGTK